MVDLSVCDTCGNDIPGDVDVCPFCEQPTRTAAPSPKRRSPKSGARIRTVNLKEGLPTVEVALKNLEMQLVAARKSKVRCLKVIHGYGSTGKGGKIRRGVHIHLSVEKQRGTIRDWLAGDVFARGEPEASRYIKMYDWLKLDSDYGARNAGITLVFL